MKPISAHEVFEEAPRGSLRAVPEAPPPRLQLASAFIFNPFRAGQRLDWQGGFPMEKKGPLLKNGEEGQ